MGLQLCRRGRQGGTEGAAPCCSLLPLSYLVLCLCGGMGTRGWTLSTLLGCCTWILHGMSSIFLLAHVLPEPCQGAAGTL